MLPWQPTEISSSQNIKMIKTKAEIKIKQIEM